MGAGQTNGETFGGLVEEALEERWRSLPLLATHAGARGWDHTLGDFSAGEIARGLRVKKALLRRLGGLKLPPGSEIALDRKILAGRITVQIAEIEGWRRLEWDPGLYPLQAIRSLYVLLLKELPAKYRRESIRARLAEFPALLRTGILNIARADRTATELALAAAASGAEFLRSRVKGIDPRGVETALSALDGYGAHLRRSVLPASGRLFAAGRELFELKLRLEHGLPYDARGLEEIGREELARTKEDLARLARSIDGRGDWRSLIHRLKRDLPPERRIVETYRRESRKVRAFCRNRGLASFPRGESLRITPTPRFEWDTTPYAAMLPPGPFEASRKSEFWVTPVDPAWPARTRKERLKGHCLWGIPVVTAHEGYPGHHLQLVRSNLSRSTVRKVYTTPVLIEGWALYCERMMEEEGYLKDPRTRLFRLKDKLWRAARVVVDAGLHCRGWSHSRAVDFMVGEALLERPNAAAEVNRYALTPTQPMSYLMGKREILKLRSKAKRKWGGGFSLRRFHDWLLDQGSGPPSWLKP